MEAALNPLLPEPPETADVRQTLLTGNQARGFSRAIAAHHHHAVAELPLDQAPLRRLPAHYQRHHLQGRDNPAGVLWELLIPLGALAEHKAAAAEHQERLVSLRAIVKEELTAMANHTRLKSPEFLLRLAGKMPRTMTYRPLNPPHGRELPEQRKECQKLERDLQQEYRQRFQGRPQASP